jgi:3-phenylpropionate/trans-cinnamate dioxygenase ferredoxin component
MSYIEVLKKDEIEEGMIKSVKVEGREIMVVNHGDSYYALNRKCTHMGGDLSRGKLEGKIVTCPVHGAKFDITTGKNISGPKIGFMKLKAGDLKVYEVKIEGDSIMVDI